MLFADDNIIFCKADVETNMRVQLLLKKYENALCQKITREKTSMVFSRNMPFGKQEEIMSLWSVSQVQYYDTYLGLPPVIGRPKSQVFKRLSIKFDRNYGVGRSRCFSKGKGGVNQSFGILNPYLCYELVVYALNLKV